MRQSDRQGGDVMKWVYICSPLRGATSAETRCNRNAAIGYCKLATETEAEVLPIAPHVYCTTFLNDADPADREKGLKMGIELLRRCKEIWVYGDRISAGMEAEIAEAYKLDLEIRYFNADGTERSVTQ